MNKQENGASKEKTVTEKEIGDKAKDEWNQLQWNEPKKTPYNCATGRVWLAKCKTEAVREGL